jgi:hypothetical protein
VDNLNQYNGGFTLGKATVDFNVQLGYVYWASVSLAICVLRTIRVIFFQSIEGSEHIKHYVVPVGKRDTKKGESYFVAELSNTRPLQWGKYWESAAKYFSQEKIEIETGESIFCE